MDIFFEKLLDCKGKVLSDVNFKMTWQKSEVEEVVLLFDNGVEVRINAMSQKGCEVCDEDGSASDYLSFS